MDQEAWMTGEDWQEIEDRMTPEEVEQRRRAEELNDELERERGFRL